MNKKLANQLKGGDLRSIGKVADIIKQLNSQKDFDELFMGLFDTNRVVVMRCADAIEKITILHPEYLNIHKKELIKLLTGAENKELKWHLAQLITRVKLNEEEVGVVWNILTQWAMNKKESKIVRVMSIQGLFDVLKQYPELKADYEQTLAVIEKEPVPSIAARIRILRKKAG
ncbi:MAG: hypothetical protein ACLQQ4_16895 [Bacteroidia bacterium]